MRTQHYRTIFETRPNIPWFEVLTENYLGDKALPLKQLLKIREHYPITLHGVSLSIGSSDPLNWDYLHKVKALADVTAPSWISDHLCWTSLNRRYIPDLLPLPHTDEAIEHVANRILQVQDFFKQRILIENVSRYISFENAPMPEWEFINAIVEKADCYILLDLNNLHVNACNHHFSAPLYLQSLNAARIKQFHLAGFEDKGTHLLDTHSRPIAEPVWELYRQALSHCGPVPTLIEWDSDIPEFAVLLEQAKMASNLMETCSVEFKNAAS